LTPPVAVCTAVAAVVAVAARARREIFLVTLILLSVALYALVAIVWFPSYLTFVVVPVAVLLARAIAVCASVGEGIAQRLAPRASRRPVAWLAALLALPFVGAALGRDHAVLTAPEQAVLPAVEQRFLRGWTSGRSVPEAADFLRAQARDGKM